MKKILSPRPKNPAPAAAASSPTAEPTAARYTPRGGSKNRILIATKDGRIDFAAMSSDSSKALNELLHDPEVQAQFGIGPLTQGFDPQHCKRIYQAIGIFLMGLGKTVFRWPDEAVLKLSYSDAEQEELAKPTATVLDELAPKWLRENQALASLVLVFSAMTQQKLREAVTIAVEVKKRQAAAAGGGDRKPPQAAGVTAAAPAAETVRMRVPISIDPTKTNGADVEAAPPSFGGSVGGVQPKI